ncbi:hypothetical protein Tco_0211307 [Tanacetum coccineum]
MASHRGLVRTDQDTVAPSDIRDNMPPSSSRLTVPWKWLANIIPKDCIIHLIDEKFMALSIGISDEINQDETL